ncbi:2-keto-4-pentenoate hydratase/2-oxohepta-3-ene-1,7-dioic acid hydratase in catechol pathway [Litorivivens lipolytica]|uniref:2-keto-4-pentenoate hydratase/2-oxohepta-3-ene-1,7-dioic acid hydratase in catechol pathway n=1 Tax=Litorivivens lipolytica TaxID=1524264 RepID=A0A7W4W4T6_9GAMM|nr:fumarylacetoacetate hydrolase family protein [Litorivivens lipolytica]MBB3047409.1 2-keto-4-pentenoate hydratase/2-oxohepta-3-ene-1,7-dioic acid hydratase in catechol pathway [Litorivivens lipolytica]
MSFQHHWLDGEPIELTTKKVVCAGLNYALHVKEMNSKAPDTEPVLFIKPATALQSLHQALTIPMDRGAVHHEVEIALLIGKRLKNCSASEAVSAISGVGLALDLTLRDLQNEFKKAGRPWEKAKGFDGACPISHFVPISQCPPLDNIDLSLEVNGKTRQRGNSRDMLFPIPSLLCAISEFFTLEPGDIVLTGTPEGVGPLHPSDELTLNLGPSLRVNTRVAPTPAQ